MQTLLPQMMCLENQTLDELIVHIPSLIVDASFHVYLLYLYLGILTNSPSWDGVVDFTSCISCWFYVHKIPCEDNVLFLFGNQWIVKFKLLSWCLQMSMKIDCWSSKVLGATAEKCQGWKMARFQKTFKHARIEM